MQSSNISFKKIKRRSHQRISSHDRDPLGFAPDSLIPPSYRSQRAPGRGEWGLRRDTHPPTARDTYTRHTTHHQFFNSVQRDNHVIHIPNGLYSPKLLAERPQVLKRELVLGAERQSIGDLSPSFGSAGCGKLYKARSRKARNERNKIRS